MVTKAVPVARSTATPAAGEGEGRAEEKMRRWGAGVRRSKAEMVAGEEEKAAMRRRRESSTARADTKEVESEGEVRVWMTPASETEEMRGWRRDPMRKCWRLGSHARDEGWRSGEGRGMTWRERARAGFTKRRRKGRKKGKGDMLV